MTRERATRFRFDPSEEEIADLLKCSAVLQRKTHQVGEGSATRDAHAASTMPWNGISQQGKAGLQNPSNPVGDTINRRFATELFSIAFIVLVAIR